jgi:hypothetical protein
MQSKLKSLAEEKSASDIQFMSRASMQWLTNRISELRNPRSIPKQIAREKDRFVTRFMLGALYFFFYDPKTKANLPYYDKFPLVMVLERYSDGFLGLNLHYLPIKHRIALLKKLVEYGGIYNEQDEIKRVRVTYDILNASRRFKEFRPCLKKYLYSNLQSRILAVQPSEWEVATYLPIQQFKGAQPKEVWQDSMNEIRKS